MIVQSKPLLIVWQLVLNEANYEIIRSLSNFNNNDFYTKKYLGAKEEFLTVLTFLFLLQKEIPSKLKRAI